MVEPTKTALRPTTIEELSQTVREATRLDVVGDDHHRNWRMPIAPDAARLELSGLTGIVEHYVDDQVVVVRAGTSMHELQTELDRKGQCLPMVDWHDGYSHLNVRAGTVGGHLSMNLPHELEGECGTWRDWVLGVTLVQADGTVAKAGSRAVKNVAGYDLARLLIGARGTLAVIAEVILRTFPVKSLPEPKVIGQEGEQGDSIWVQRTLMTDFEQARAATAAYHGDNDPNTATLTRWIPEHVELPRYPGDWVLRSGCGDRNLEITDPTQIRLMRRTKELFDPTGKLNPGEMGIF